MQTRYHVFGQKILQIALFLLIACISACSRDEAEPVAPRFENRHILDPASSGEVDINLISQQLSSKCARDRYNAAISVGRAHGQAVPMIRMLIELLDDHDVAIASRRRTALATRVRDGAIAALVALGPGHCVEPCINAWRENRATPRGDGLLAVLSQFDDSRVVAFFLVLIEDSDEATCAGAIDAISFRTDPRYKSILCKKLTHDGTKVRIAAASAIARMADPGCLDSILSALASSDYRVRYPLLHALGRIDDDRCRSVLRALLDSSDIIERTTAVGSLCLIGSADDRRRLIGILEDRTENDGIRLRTANGLLRAIEGRNARDEVIRLVRTRTEGDNFRCELIDAMGEVEGRGCIEVVASIVRDRSENEVVRCGAAIVVAEVLTGAVESLDLVAPLTFPYKLAIGLDPEAETRARRREAIELVAENGKTPSVRDFANRLLRAQ